MQKNLSNNICSEALHYSYYSIRLCTIAITLLGPVV